jgi:hypothetical protein
MTRSTEMMEKLPGQRGVMDSYCCSVLRTSFDLNLDVKKRKQDSIVGRNVHPITWFSFSHKL